MLEVRILCEVNWVDLSDSECQHLLSFLTLRGLIGIPLLHSRISFWEYPHVFCYILTAVAYDSDEFNRSANTAMLAI